MSDNNQPLNELYMYFMLNYLCMPKDVPVEELVRKYKGMSTKLKAESIRQYFEDI